VQLRERPDGAAAAAAYGRHMSFSRRPVPIAVATVASVLVGLATASVHDQARSSAPAHNAQLQRIARGLVNAGAPGAVVVVRTQGGIREAAAGFARLRPREQMQATDRFRIASVTKTFVATAVLQLAAEGPLRLGDPVERWLPGLVPNGASITLRQLLNHTSGLFNVNEDDDFKQALIADPGRSWSPRDVLAVAFSHPPLFAPGTNWSYSNTNYVVLGLVIEAATGGTLEQELEQRILTPLKLDATSFPTSAAIEGPFAHGYVGPHPGLPIARGTLLDVSTILSPSFAWGSGNMVSNAPDLTHFFAALLRGRLLPARQLAEMKTGSSGNAVYGLGLRTTYAPCGTAVGHEGDIPGYRTAVWATPNGRRVAVAMVNIDETHVPWSRIEAAATTALCTG
jgi:D-alanyl-D-alanine carboxypeptidase